MEGKDRQLVEEPAEGHGQAGDRQRRASLHPETGGHLRQVRRAGEPEEVAQAEEHDSVRGHAKHDVFDGRFHLAALAPSLAAHGNEQVEGKRRQFKGHDERYHVDAADQHHQPGRAQRDKQKVLGLDLVPYVGEIPGQKHDCRKAAGEGELQQLGEGVDPVRPAEEVRPRAQRKDAGEDRRRGDDQGGLARGAALGSAQGHHKQAERPADKHQLGKKGLDEGGGHGVRGAGRPAAGDSPRSRASRAGTAQGGTRSRRRRRAAAPA